MDSSKSMFQFHPALQPKKSARTSTPRGLVVPAPDATASLPETEDAADENPRPDHVPSRSLSASARKYQVDATAVKEVIDQYGLATGLPSPRASETSARPSQHSQHPRHSHDPTRLQARGAATQTPAASRRTVRNSLHYLHRESLLLTKQLVRSTHHLYRHLSLQQLLAYLLVLVGILSESFTPAPRHNVPLGIVIFMTSANGGLEFQLDHRVVVTGLCATTLLDVAWLLRPQEPTFNAFLRVEVENATHVCLAMCAALKLWLLFAAYFDLGPELDEATTTTAGPEAAGEKPGVPPPRLLGRARFLFPRKTLPRRSHLSYEVLMRVLSLVWLHGVCGVVLLVLGLITAMGLSGAAVFRSATLGLSLPLAMLFKSVTTLLSYVIATHHMSYHACLTVSGCDRLAKYYEASASDVVLRYNATWLRRVRHAKVLDAVLGVYLMAVYYAAVHNTTFIAGDSVLTVLVLTATIIVVLDIWVPLLILVVARCGSVLNRHHRDGTADVDPYYPNQLEWEGDEADDSKDKTVKRSASSSSSSSSSSASSSDEASSDSEKAGDSSSGSNTDARRRRRQRRPSQRQLRSQLSSRRPQVPPLPLARNSPMLIINDCDVAEHYDDLVGSSTPFWVRYWDDASERSYLVHGLTNETVWEIGGPPASARSKVKSSSIQSPRSGGDRSGSVPDTTASSPALRVVSPRAMFPTMSSFPPPVFSRPSPRHTQGSARVSFHPTSESDVIVTTSPAAITQPQRSGRSSSRRKPSALLSATNFSLQWDALPDGGNFTCRVSKVPTVDELRLHLHTHGFVVAADGLNVASLRSIHFYAIVGSTTDAVAASVVFFLGEFVFDSLSLKLHARFRCPDVDAIVPFVKTLQLKEIVGAYAPCD